MYGYQRGNCRGRGKKSGALDEDTHTTIHTITNKDLLYSTGNSTQYSVTTYVRKESKKRKIRVCIELNHCTVDMKLTQCCKSSIHQKN